MNPDETSQPKENGFKKQHFKRSLKIDVKLTSNFIRPFMRQNFFTIFFAIFLHICSSNATPQLPYSSTSSRKKVVQKRPIPSSKNHQETVRRTTQVGALQSSIDSGPTVREKIQARIPKIPGNMTLLVVGFNPLERN